MTLEFAKTEAIRRTAALKTTHYVIKTVMAPEPDCYIVTTRIPRGYTPVAEYKPSAVTPPAAAVPSHPIDLFRELARLFLATEASPLHLANVEFWIDAVGPFADTLSFSVPADKWDARAMGESVAQLARVYPEVTRIVARYASPNWYGVQSDMRSEPPTV